MASFLLSIACSRPARIRRSLSASKKCCERAEDYLISGNIAISKKYADKSLTYAEQADRLEPSGVLEDMTEKQLNRSELFSSALDDPGAVPRLFWYLVAEGNTEPALSFFDAGEAVKGIYAGVSSQASMDELEEMYTNSIAMTFRNYKDTAAATPIKTKGVEFIGDDKAVVECYLEIKFRSIESTTLWLLLNKKEDLWRVYDVRGSSEGKKADITMNEVLNRYFLKGTLEEDVTKLFRGRDLLSAFLDVEELGMVIPYLGEEKPLMNHYVRTLEAVVLEDDDQEIAVKSGEVLKVVNQYKASTGEDVLVVTGKALTTFTGEISGKSVEDIGTEESELWGLGL